MSKNQTENIIEKENQNRGRRNIFSYTLPLNKGTNGRRNNSMEIRRSDDKAAIVQIVDDPNAKTALDKVKRISNNAMKYSASKKGNTESEITEKKNKTPIREIKEFNKKEGKTDNKNGKDFEQGPIKKVGPNYAIRNVKVNLSDRINKTNEKIKTIDTNNKNIINGDNEPVNNYNNSRRKNYAVKVINACKNNNNIVNDNSKIRSRNNNTSNHFTKSINMTDNPVKSNTCDNDSPFQPNLANDKNIKDNKKIMDNKNIQEKKDNKENKEIRENKYSRDNRGDRKSIENLNKKDNKPNNVNNDNKKNNDIKDNKDYKVNRDKAANENNMNNKRKELVKNKTDITWDRGIKRLSEKSDNNNNKDKENKDNNGKDKEKKDYNINKNIKEDNRIRNTPNYKRTVTKSEDKKLDKEKEKEGKKDKGEDKLEDEDGLINVNIKKNFKVFTKKDDKKEEEKSPKKIEKDNEPKFEQIKREEIKEIPGENYNTKIEIRKRFGDCHVIFKKEEKVIKNKNSPKKEEKKEKENIIEEPKKEENKKEEDKRIIDEPKENPKKLNKANDNIRFYRRNIVIHNPNDEEEKQENIEQLIKEEIKPDYDPKKENNTFTETIIEKKVIIDDGTEENPRVYKKRHYKRNNDDYRYKPRIPRRRYEDKKYVKRPSNQPMDFVYTKQIIDKNNNEDAPYDYQMKNIRITIKKDRLGDDDDVIYDNRKIQTPFQKYHNTRKLNYQPKYITSNTYDEFLDNSGSISKYRKKEFLPSYDDINEMDDDEDYNEKNNTRDNKYDVRYKEYKKEKNYYRRDILNDDDGRNY